LSLLQDKEIQDIDCPQTYLGIEQKLTKPILREILKEKARSDEIKNLDEIFLLTECFQPYSTYKSRISDF
jgi:hypothetical protein